MTARLLRALGRRRGLLLGGAGLLRALKATIHPSFMRSPAWDIKD